MENQVGIASAAYALPGTLVSSRQILAEEGITSSDDLDTRLGIDSVPLCTSETGSALALTAAQEALRRAGLDAAQLDVIVDFTILPQEYLVPAWNMSNKLQHELGARKAFTVGFSGGAASNFIVALVSATTMLQTDEKLKNALLVAADITIPGNRVLNAGDPVSVLGDSASAMILQKGSGKVVIDYSLKTVGANHDVYYIPGGALANHHPEAYRLQLDKARFDTARQSGGLGKMVAEMLTRAGVDRRQLSSALLPNISSQDQLGLQKELGLTPEQMSMTNRKMYGHLQGNDFILNFLDVIENKSPEAGSFLLAASHGMGFMPAAALIRC